MGGESKERDQTQEVTITWMSVGSGGAGMSD